MNPFEFRGWVGYEWLREVELSRVGLVEGGGGVRFSLLGSAFWVSLLGGCRWGCRVARTD